jgi:GntR family transcriptional regulator, transcriptional repressor for pyruvate dehydrogenase complex
MQLADEGPDSFQAARRTHVADAVFDQIAAAILRGELAAGSTLPPERVLAERFETSRIIARQALHRLAELGLVRVRQGGATLVLDPNEAGDLRILELVYRLAPSGAAGAIDARQTLERQLLQGLCLVEVAARCGKRADLEQVDTMTADFASGDVDEAGYRAFEERFWRRVAAAGKSRIFRMEVAWWYRVIGAPPRAERYVPSALAARVAFYRELARRLAKDQEPVLFYLKAVGPLLSVLRSRAAVPISPARRKAAPRSSR